jgi:hypothetical protein
MELGDTPWVDRTWRSVLDRVRDRVDVEDEWLPRVSKRRPLKFEEYGCGAYGCVSPTEEPGLVVKLTSDLSEATFVSWALSIDQPKAGMIRYHKILAVPGATYRGRPVFIIWRDEAYSTGTLSQWGGFRSQYDVELSLLESTMLPAAREVGIAVRRWRSRMTPEAFLATLGQLWSAHRQEVAAPRHVQAVVKELQKVRGAIERLATTRFKGIALALRHYLERGVILADVRGANLGKLRGTYYEPGDWAIIDPSLAIVLNPDVDVPPIESV